MHWKNRIKKFHPALIVLTVIFLIFGYGFEVLIFMIALTFHELAHGLVAKKFGYTLSNFYLMPYGACLSYKENVFLEREEILISLAGPVVNLVLCLLLIAFWWLIPVTYAYTYYFVECNFYLALFNFLPCYPLDCGRIIKAIIKNKYSDAVANKISKILCYVFTIFFIFLFIISCFISINFNYLIISIILFTGVFDNIFQGKYERIYINKEKLLNKGIGVKTIAISGDFTLLKAYKKMCSTKYNVLYLIIDGKTKIITENTLLKLMETYNVKTTFNQIYM